MFFSKTKPILTNDILEKKISKSIGKTKSEDLFVANIVKDYILPNFFYIILIFSIGYFLYYRYTETKKKKNKGDFAEMLLDTYKYGKKIYTIK